MAQEQDQKARREAMKRLRAQRKDKISAASARMKEQKRAIEAITRVLKEGAKTVPQVSEETGISTSEVLWYIAALRKYGQVAEGEKDGSYFLYELVHKAQGAESSEAEE